MPRSDVGPADLACEARRLRDEWRRLSARQAYVGGCACGAPSAQISFTLIETDIVDFLLRKYERLGDGPCLFSGSDDLPTILTRLETNAGARPEVAALLADIAGSIASLDHRRH